MDGVTGGQPNYRIRDEDDLEGLVPQHVQEAFGVQNTENTTVYCVFVRIDVYKAVTGRFISFSW